MKNSAFKSMVINLQERANIIFQREKELKQQQQASYSISNRRGAPISQGQLLIKIMWYIINSNYRTIF